VSRGQACQKILPIEYKITASQMKTSFFYSSSYASFNDSEAYLAIIGNKEYDERSFLRMLSEKLCFPDYFGFNWDALSDCLRDFHWIIPKKIIIFHSILPNLPVKDLKIYLRVLNFCVNDWKANEAHELVVIFPPQCEYKILELMSD
jgi:hypothetical protein